MALERVVADTGRLFCDNVGIADVEFSITVRRSETDDRTSATGFLRGDMKAIETCRNTAMVELATRHFGRVLIQIHRIDAFHAHFNLAEPFGALGVDPPLTPDLASEPELQVGGRRIKDA